MSKTFRLFISSTFSDFEKEREVLHTKVFPEIEKHCIKNALTFQPVDLRWGVNNEAQVDQKTLELCLKEVRACKHFPHPNFLIMAGDRYGYIPLPYMIEEYEFEHIKKSISIDNDLDILTNWYKLDTNQIPASYILQQRTDIYEDYPAWEQVEIELRVILQDAANKIFHNNKNDKEYQKYFLSATEQEVIEGICKFKGKTLSQTDCDDEIDKKYIFGYLRDIANADDKYIDADSSLKERAKEFKDALADTLDKENKLSAKFNSISEYESDKLKKFERYMTDKLIASINEQVKSEKEISLLDQEIQEQSKFRTEKLKGFQGRENTLTNIDNYLSNPNNAPLIIHGPSGMGKSSLVAQAIEDEENKLDSSITFYRFVGATASSTTIRNLLISIVDDLQDKNIVDEVTEYELDDNEFDTQIKEILLAVKKETVIFIDALDQLQHKSHLNWLPNELPMQLKIVLSVLNDEKYEEDTHFYHLLSQRYDNSTFIDITQDSLQKNEDKLISKLLEAENRKLDDKQREKLLKRFSESNYSPLYLKIAIEEVKKWKAGDETQELEDGVEGIILEYFNNLTTLYHHEELLVKKVFGYIVASRDGLSERELLQILSEDLEDEEEFRDKIINRYHKPIKVKNPRRDNKEEYMLPISVWSRLQTQIKPFIIERNIENQPLMKFFHRQFTTVVEEYIKEDKTKLHTKLANYFYTLQDKTKVWGERYYNPHMLDELPYHLFYSNDSTRLKEILFDLEFAGSVYDNHRQESFREILQKVVELKEIREDEISPWESFYREKEHLITQVDDEQWKPKQTLFQLAYEDGDNSPLSQFSDKLIENSKVDFNWFKNTNRVESSYKSGLKNVLKGNNALELKDGRILSWSSDNSLKIWSSDGKEIAVLEGHTDGTKGALELKDGKILSWAQDRTLRIWSSGGEEITVLAGHTDTISGASELKDGKILSWSSDNSLKIWSSDGKEIAALEGHTDTISGASELKDGKILSWSSDKTLRIWSSHGKEITVLEEHIGSVNGALELKDGRILSWANSMASFDRAPIVWSSDGKKIDNLLGHTAPLNGVLELEDGRILSWSSDNSLKIWSSDGKEIAILEEHIGSVNGALELKDGRTLSWSQDRTLRIWSNHGEEITVLEGHTHTISGASELKDGRILSWSSDKTLRIWSSHGEEIAVLEGHDVRAAFELKDGRILSFGDSTLRIWSSYEEGIAVFKEYTDWIDSALELKNKRIVSWAYKTLRIWSSHGEEIAVLEGHTDFINGALELKDGKILSWTYSPARGDKTLRLWSVDGEEIAVLEGHTDGTKGALELGDGKILSWAQDRTLRIWTSDGKEIAVLEGHTDFINGALELKDGRILSWASDKTLRIWTSDGKERAVLTGHTASLDGALELKDERILSWPSDKTLRIWSSDGKEIAVLKGHTDLIVGASELKDGRILSWSSDKTLRIWSSHGEEIAVLEGHTDWINGALELKDGKILSWAYPFTGDNTLKLWSSDGKEIAVLEGHTDWIDGASELKYGKILSWSNDKTLRIWSSDGEEFNKWFLANETAKIGNVSEQCVLLYDTHPITYEMINKKGN